MHTSRLPFPRRCYLSSNSIIRLVAGPAHDPIVHQAPRRLIAPAGHRAPILVVLVHRTRLGGKPHDPIPAGHDGWLCMGRRFTAFPRGPGNDHSRGCAPVYSWRCTLDCWRGCCCWCERAPRYRAFRQSRFAAGPSNRRYRSSLKRPRDAMAAGPGIPLQRCMGVRI